MPNRRARLTVISTTFAYVFGLPVAQVERARPAFYGGIIGQGELRVGALQALEQRGIFYRDGGLPGQGIQEIEPFYIRFKVARWKISITPLTWPLAINGIP